MATFDEVNGQQLADSIQSLSLQSHLFQSVSELKMKNENKDEELTGYCESSAGNGSSDHHGVCAICLNKILLQETALVKGCEHAYCVTCILRWASCKNEPTCPQCKHPFESLLINRSLDGSLQDYMSEESICLLLRAAWFKPLIVEEREEVDDEMEEFYSYEDEDDDLHEAYFGRSSNLRIGNRRWGDNGYVRGGRQEARPRPVHCPSFQDSGTAGSSRQAKKKEVPKEIVGRRAKRAQKREAADKAAAEKHQQRLIRLGRVCDPALEVESSSASVTALELESNPASVSQH